MHVFPHPSIVILTHAFGSGPPRLLSLHEAMMPYHFETLLPFRLLTNFTAPPFVLPSFPWLAFCARVSVISHPRGSLERGKQAGWTLACKAWPLPDVYSPRQFNQSVPAGLIRGAASVCRIRYILKWICYSLITPLRLVPLLHLQCNMKIQISSAPLTSLLCLFFQTGRTLLPFSEDPAIHTTTGVLMALLSNQERAQECGN